MGGSIHWLVHSPFSATCCPYMISKAADCYSLFPPTQHTYANHSTSLDLALLRSSGRKLATWKGSHFSPSFQKLGKSQWEWRWRFLMALKLPFFNRNCLHASRKEPGRILFHIMKLNCKIMRMHFRFSFFAQVGTSHELLAHELFFCTWPIRTATLRYGIL